MTTFSSRKVIRLGIAVIFSLIVVTLAFYQFFYRSPRVQGDKASLHHVFRGHRHIVTSVRFAKNDSLVISGSVDSSIIIWSPNGSIFRTINQPSGVSFMDVSSDGEFIVTGGYDGIVRLWRILDGALVRSFKKHNGTVWTVSFSADGKSIASAGDDKFVRVWNTETGALSSEFSGHTLTIWAVKFFPGADSLASCSFDGSIRIWNTKTGKPAGINTAHTSTVADIAFNNSGTMLASGSDDCTVKLWDVRSGKLVRQMKVAEHVQSLAFSPDGNYLLAGGRDKPMIGEFLQNLFGNSEMNKGVSARLYDVRTGELLQTFTEHSNDADDIAFGTTGKLFATASVDNTVHVWRFRP
jgi:WD40 repeat protein